MSDSSLQQPSYCVERGTGNGAAEFPFDVPSVSKQNEFGVRVRDYRPASTAGRPGRVLVELPNGISLLLQFSREDAAVGPRAVLSFNTPETRTRFEAEILDELKSFASRQAVEATRTARNSTDDPFDFGAPFSRLGR